MASGEKRVVRGLPPKNIPDFPELLRVHPEGRRVRVYDVDYLHVKADDGGDLYVPEWGYPQMNLLQPSRWKDQKTRDNHLGGTSAAYKVSVGEGDAKRDIVVKFSRFGEVTLGNSTAIYVPAELEDAVKTTNTDFSSPFREVRMVMELRRNDEGGQLSMLTQKPLAIYVSPNESDLRRDERAVNVEKAKLAQDQATQPDGNRVEFNENRIYAVMYEWVKGEPANVALKRLGWTPAEIMEFTKKVIDDLVEKGFATRDIKPDSVIVRPRRKIEGSLDAVDDPDKKPAEGREGPNKRLVQRSDGSIAYVIVDYELMVMTPEKVIRRRINRRQEFYKHLRHWDEPHNLPENLKMTEIMGLPYIVGEVPERGGHLLVLGKNPNLFGYFLPEKWDNCERKRLGPRGPMYRIVSDDGLHLVVGHSNVGEKAGAYKGEDRFEDIMEHGFNSPYEKVRIALELKKSGIQTAWPRAIYIPKGETISEEHLVDDRRYMSHEGILLPDGSPALPRGRELITIDGEYRGWDPLSSLESSDTTAQKDQWGMTSLEMALYNQIIKRERFESLEYRAGQFLRGKGLNPRDYPPQDIMMKFDEVGKLELLGPNPKLFIVASATAARAKNLITEDQFDSLIQRETQKLQQAGYESLMPLGDHLLLNYSLGLGPVSDDEGIPFATHCSFDLYKRIG